MPAVITKAISRVDCTSKSILPTGKLKFEDGILYQAAVVIIHKAHDGLEIGMKSEEWFPVPADFLESIKRESAEEIKA